MLLQAGFTLLRSRGSHRIYSNGPTRVVVPFHGAKTLHPKIVRQVIDAVT
jgi:predicted RNA binding protein YcfA (HicA-like mRNA interferase family)